MLVSKSIIFDFDTNKNQLYSKADLSILCQKDTYRMTQKLVLNKRKYTRDGIKPKEGMWITYQLRLKGITQKELANQLKINTSNICLILTGRRRSRRIEDLLFQTLGFSSFEEMIQAARTNEGLAV